MADELRKIKKHDSTLDRIVISIYSIHKGVRAIIWYPGPDLMRSRDVQLNVPA
jgi:hypothetical protein